MFGRNRIRNASLNVSLVEYGFYFILRICETGVRMQTTAALVMILWLAAVLAASGQEVAPRKKCLGNEMTRLTEKHKAPICSVVFIRKAEDQCQADFELLFVTNTMYLKQKDECKAEDEDRIRCTCRKENCTAQATLLRRKLMSVIGSETSIKWQKACQEMLADWPPRVFLYTSGPHSATPAISDRTLATTAAATTSDVSSTSAAKTSVATTIITTTASQTNSQANVHETVNIHSSTTSATTTLRTTSSSATTSSEEDGELQYRNKLESITTSPNSSSTWFGLFIGAAVLNVLQAATIVALAVSMFKMKKGVDGKKKEAKKPKEPTKPSSLAPHPTVINIENPVKAKDNTSAVLQAPNNLDALPTDFPIDNTAAALDTTDTLTGGDITSGSDSTGTDSPFQGVVTVRGLHKN